MTSPQPSLETVLQANVAGHSPAITTAIFFGAAAAADFTCFRSSFRCFNHQITAAFARQPQKRRPVNARIASASVKRKGRRVRCEGQRTAKRSTNHHHHHHQQQQQQHQQAHHNLQLTCTRTQNPQAAFAFASAADDQTCIKSNRRFSTTSLWHSHWQGP